MLVFGKTYHLPIELEHKYYWDVRQCNLDDDLAVKRCKLWLQELEEIRLEAYANSMLYKGKAKAFHDAKLSLK